MRIRILNISFNSNRNKNTELRFSDVPDYETTTVAEQRQTNKLLVTASVGNPDPYVFGPPGSGSGSFYHQEKKVRKTLIPTVY